MHEVSLPPIKVLVRREFLYDLKKGHGEYDLGLLISARSIPGSAMLFQVLLENGVLRDKLPISAILHKPTQAREFDELQLWNCFSANFCIVELNYLCGTRVEFYNKRKKWESGLYLFTFQWGSDMTYGIDLTQAEDPSEHKSGHFLQLDTGEFAIQPNNRLRFIDPSFTTKPFPENPDYKVNTQSYNCETSKKWITEDTDRYFYSNS